MFASLGWKRARKEPAAEEVECSASAPVPCPADLEGPELSAQAASGDAQAREEDGQPAEDLEAASVRAKALYFESIIECRTRKFHAGDAGDVAMDPCASPASSRGTLKREPTHADAVAASSVEGSAQYGSVAAMEALIAALRGQLIVKEAQRQSAADDARRKAGECENLRVVVGELAASRAKAVQARAALAERYADLQREFHRTLRIAELSRTVSRENMAKSSRQQKALRAAQSELHATRRQATSLHDRARRIKGENAALQEKLNLLERLDYAEVQESACMREFTLTRIAETY